MRCLTHPFSHVTHLTIPVFFHSLYNVEVLKQNDSNCRSSHHEFSRLPIPQRPDVADDVSSKVPTFLNVTRAYVQFLLRHRANRRK